MPSAAPSAIPASSASPELTAMAFWVVGHRLITQGPHIAAPPHVGRRVVRLGAQGAAGRSASAR
eukprot:12753964-Alexandrium_andersonii.AAC.1